MSSQDNSMHRDNSAFDRRTFSKFALAGAGGIFGYHGWAFGEEPKQPAKKQNGKTAEKPKAEEPEVYGEPLPFVDGSFTLVALPDTQHYAAKYHQHFFNQTDWIVKNEEKFNIQFVMHLGDITNNNLPQHWEVAKKAISRLDGNVPYSLAPGNHDYGPNGSCKVRETSLNDYFTTTDAKKQPTFGGSMDDSRLENNYHTFTVGGQKFLVLALEWGPRDEVVAWADATAAKYPDHHMILTTHAYMYYDETRYDFAKYGKKQTWNPHTYGTAANNESTNDGEELWNKLVSKHKGFFLTLNGHVIGDGQARLTSKGPSGNNVHQVLANYQMKHEGGDAFLRLIEFLPDGKTVQMKSYSPSLDKFKVDPQNQFVLKLTPSWA